ncbi:MAG TPA: MoxR family ATPase [Actinomycetota bacterium]|nr:MoxR family ATPase [Actinomycetota bacterium]
MATTTMSRKNPSRRVALDAKTYQRIFDAVVDNASKVVLGKDEVVRLALVAMLAEGHILFEDVPGVGKTVLARALAQSMNAVAGRIQCTPDMLPGDITGSSIYDQDKKKFVFHEGPIFANILLADEINRATPKTQSALLEAMAERRVTGDGVVRNLPRPFLVLATQNPVEQAGTFPLPEAQLDRFMFKLRMGYPGREAEHQIMFGNAKELPVDSLGSIVDTETMTQMIQFAQNEVKVSEAVGYYIVDISQATREEAGLTLGASPRAPINLLRAAKVLAASDGRSDVYPDDIRHILMPVMAHRLFLSPDSILRGETVEAVLERIVGRVKAPLMSDVKAGGDGRSVLKKVKS